MLMLIFEVGEQKLALKTDVIVEVLPALKLQSIHGAASAIAGLFNYQGRIVPVVAMNQLLGERPGAATLKQRIILIQPHMTELEGKMVGLLVENIVETTSISLTELKSNTSDQNISDLFENPYLGKIFLRNNEILQCLTPDSILSDQAYHDLVSPLQSHG